MIFILALSLEHVKVFLIFPLSLCQIMDIACNTLAFVMGPTLLARTRVNEGLRIRMEAGVKSEGVMGEFGLSMSILNEAIKRDGIKTLTIGLPTMILKRSCDWGCRFLFMGIVKEQWRKNKANPDDGIFVMLG